MAGVEQNRYKTNNGCIKHLPQTGLTEMFDTYELEGYCSVWESDCDDNSILEHNINL